MKVLFFLHSPNPFPGAQWRRIEFFAEYFQTRGHEVTVAGAFSLKSLDKAGTTRVKGIRLLNITPIIMFTNIASILFNITSSLLTSFIPFLLTRPNIVIISVPVGETSLGPFVWTQIFRTRSVAVDYRDEWEDYAIRIAKSGIYRKICESLKKRMTKFYSKCYIVMASTKVIAQDLSERGLQNIKVVTNGADMTIFKPYDKYAVRSKLGLEKEDFIIVYSGNIGGYYRLDLAVKALGRLRNKNENLKLLMIGRGQIGIDNVMELAREMNIHKSVLFLGSKSDKIEIAEIISAADIGLIPYDSNPLWKNTLPVKCLEYLACGIPVIATTFSDSVLAELIEEHRVGVISEPENLESLVASVEKLISDPLFLNEAGKRALTVIADNFDRNKIAKDVYQELLRSLS